MYSSKSKIAFTLANWNLIFEAGSNWELKQQQQTDNYISANFTFAWTHKKLFDFLFLRHYNKLITIYRPKAATAKVRAAWQWHAFNSAADQLCHKEALC